MLQTKDTTCSDITQSTDWTQSKYQIEGALREKSCAPDGGDVMWGNDRIREHVHGERGELTSCEQTSGCPLARISGVGWRF